MKKYLLSLICSLQWQYQQKLILMYINNKLIKKNANTGWLILFNHFSLTDHIPELPRDVPSYAFYKKNISKQERNHN